MRYEGAVRMTGLHEEKVQPVPDSHFAPFEAKPRSFGENINLPGGDAKPLSRRGVFAVHMIERIKKTAVDPIDPFAEPKRIGCRQEPVACPVRLIG